MYLGIWLGTSSIAFTGKRDLSDNRQLEAPIHGRLDYVAFKFVLSWQRIATRSPKLVVTILTPSAMLAFLIWFRQVVSLMQLAPNAMIGYTAGLRHLRASTPATD